MEWNGMEWNGIRNAEYLGKPRVFREKNLKIFSLYTMRRRVASFLTSRIASFCTKSNIFRRYFYDW
jgi:hypothetical protein